MKKLLLAAAAALALCGPAAAQVGVFGAPNTNNLVNISSATTTKIVTGNAAFTINITAFAFVSAGAGTVKLEYGTQTTNPCDTGTTTLIPAMTVAAGEYQFGDGLGGLFQVPAGNDVCVVTTSSATAVGFLTTNRYNAF